MKALHFDTTVHLCIVFVFVTIINYGCSTSVLNKNDVFTINITMNNFQTIQEDEYVYLQYKLPDEELFIVGYLPLISMNSAHHMLTYACAQSGSDKRSWTQGATCIGEQMIIHGWARNAPPLILPEDVGFRVGRNTPYKYIVINIHYLSILQNDNSGNQLIMTRKSLKYRAGVILGGTSSINLQPKTKSIRTPFSCKYNGPPISIFAARVHAHQWARVNSLYRVREGQISQIVKSDPQWPQSFYPLSSQVSIQNGDYIVGQCVYDNNDNRVIHAGSTHNDEMCNVYSMYSYDSSIISSTGENIDSPPFQMCWDNSFNEMAVLIPRDSEIPPMKPTDISGAISDALVHGHTEHGMNKVSVDSYANVATWPDVKSLPVHFDEIGGIALNSANSELVVFHRGSRKWEYKYFNEYRFRNETYGPIEEDVLIHIDTRTGQRKQQWGAKMFYMPHGLTIDHDGNFWLTDVAMHQVFMFKPNDLLHPALTVGERFQSGRGPNQFCRPADIAVMKNGDFFVADGYCNSRIIKFNHKGEYLMEWGSAMRGKLDSDGFPQPNEWNIVHSIALNEDAQLLCGADRENFRIQCFNSSTGQFQRHIRVENKNTPGAIYAIEFVPDIAETILFAVTGGIQTSNKKVYMINALTGNVLTSFESNPHFISPHDITVSANALEIYVGELASSPSNAVHKFEVSNKRKDIPLQTFNTKSYYNNKSFRISAIIMAAFAILVLITVIIGCIVRIRNLRKLNHLNAFVDDVRIRDTNRSSFIDDWKNGRRGYSKLHCSNGENESFNINADEDLNSDCVDQTEAIKVKQ